MRKPVVLITGAGGEIGHGLIEELSRGDRASVVTIDLNPLEPSLARLVQREFTGSINDVRLLDRIAARAGDELTVLDISARSNADGLKRLLAAGARLRYFDQSHLIREMRHYFDMTPGQLHNRPHPLLSITMEIRQSRRLEAIARLGAGDPRPWRDPGAEPEE